MENSYKVRTCGQHPGRMSRVGVGVVIFLFLVFFHVSEHVHHFKPINYFFYLNPKKLNFCGVTAIWLLKKSKP